MTASLPLRVVAATRSGALLAHRARRGCVVHLHTGPRTPSGRFAAAAGRTVCHTRTRRLTVLDTAAPCIDLAGRRFCRRCTTALPACWGSAEARLVTNDDWAETYAHLTVADLVQVTRWCRTVEETHQVGRLALLLFRPAPARRPADGSHAAEVYDLDRFITQRRRHLALEALTPEELEARARAAEIEASNDQMLRESRARAGRVARVQERAARGHYLLPHERELLGTG